jgi:5'-nucleotidase
VLVLQAWQWGHMLGRIQVRFTRDGEVAGYHVVPTIPVGDRFIQGNAHVPQDSEAYRLILEGLAESGVARITPEDPEIKAWLAPFARQVSAYRSVAVATAVNDIMRGLNSGPGPLAADALISAVPEAQVALLNYGGIRKDMLAGTISVGDVLEVMPFGNTLISLDLTGFELKMTLEEGIDFLLNRYPGQSPPAVPYVAGARFAVRPTAPMGERVSALAILDKNGHYQPCNSEAVYRTVVNAFVADGGDGFATIKNAKGLRYDTGIIDSDAFRDRLKSLASIDNPTQQRIMILP